MCAEYHVQPIKPPPRRVLPNTGTGCQTLHNRTCHAPLTDMTVHNYNSQLDIRKLQKLIKAARRRTCIA